MSAKIYLGSRPTAPKAGPREWWGLTILALPCLLYSMDLTVLNLAVPHIIADLAPSGAQILWIVDIYGFLLAGALIPMGAVGDRIGRRLLLMVGAAAFGMASIFAAFAQTAEMLIAARAVLGVTAATLAPSTLSLIRTMFEDDGQRRFAIGVWMASFSVGGAIGPLIGGALLEHFWWGSVFLIAVPVMVFLLLVGPFVLPEQRNTSGEKVDVLSATLSIAAVLAMVYGIKQIATVGPAPSAGAATCAGLVLGWIFLARQKRLRDPLVDLSLFSLPGFRASLFVNMASFFLAFGTLLFLAQHLQLVLGMGPFEAGMWTLLSATGFIMGSLLAPAVVRFIQPANLMAMSFVAGAAGFGLLAYALFEAEFALLMAAMFLFSIGLAPVFTLSADVIVGAAPETQAGSAAAITETSSELGAALGIAVLGSILASVYRRLINTLLPSGLPGEVENAALDSIGSALNAALDLETTDAHHVLIAAQEAFSGAFAVVAVVGVVIALFAAAAAAYLGNISTHCAAPGS